MAVPVHPCPPYPPQVRQIEETKAIGRDTLVELDNQAIPCGKRMPPAKPKASERR